MMDVRCCSNNWCHQMTWVWTKDVNDGRQVLFKQLVSLDDLGWTKDVNDGRQVLFEQLVSLDDLGLD